MNEKLRDAFLAACVARRILADELRERPRGLVGLQEQRVAQDAEDRAWRRYRRALAKHEEPQS